MKILFACSASGGHILPALSVAQAIKAKYGLSQLALLTEKNNISLTILSKSEFEVILLDVKIPFNTHIPALNSLIKLIISSSAVIKILKKRRPDIIVGFGGYVSVLPVILSRFFAASCIIHEQNVLMGRANRFLLSKAQAIAVSFKSTKDAFGKRAITRKIIHTGLPLRKDLQQYDKSQAAAFFKLDPGAFTILVLGGSMGSTAINRVFLSIADKLSGKDNFALIHICGINDEAGVRSFYDTHPDLKARVFSFLKEISFAYSLADICISRSGASAIYELGFFKLPSILIPYGHAANHQLPNARFLSDCRAAILLSEKEASGKLREILDYYANNREKLSEMKNNFPQEFIFDAADRLGDLIIERL